jgi:hypothetical protein
MTTANTQKKWKTWHKITVSVIALFIIIVVAVVSLVPKTTATVQPAQQWKDMQYEQKEAWIKKYLKDPDDQGYALISEMNKAVKSKFNYPKEVDFNFGESPTFNNVRIVDAESGTVFVEGGGTAKNSFGVKSTFTYSVRLKVTKDSLYITNVSVNEAN